MTVGTVTGVRNRDTVKLVMENLSGFPGADRCVLVESDYASRYKDIPCTDYIFRKELNSYSPSMVKNAGTRAIIDDVDIVVFCDADVMISEKVFERMIDGCSEYSLFLPKIENYEMNHGNFAVMSSVLKKHGLFNEYMIGWGYEDTDFLQRLEKAGVNVRQIDLGKVVHLHERRKPSVHPPGMPKWNTWEYNRIISDWENRIDNEELSFGYGEKRSKWPKVWMDKENVMT